MIFSHFTPPLTNHGFSDSESDSCESPTQNIVFHKSHKTSSSSIQNILLRYAKLNNLNVVLPRKGHHLGENEKFDVSVVSETPWFQAGLPPNIFCLHNIWNGQEIAKLYGERKPFYFSIIR